MPLTDRTDNILLMLRLEPRTSIFRSDQFANSAATTAFVLNWSFSSNKKKILKNRREYRSRHRLASQAFSFFAIAE